MASITRSVLAKALIVEDDKVAAHALTQTLQKFNCQTKVIMDSIQAINEAITHTYDLIFLDIGLGDKQPSGLDVVNSIRAKEDETTPNTIVVLTAQNEMEETARIVGVDAFLRKPIETSCLENLLELILKDQI